MSNGQHNLQSADDFVTAVTVAIATTVAAAVTVAILFLSSIWNLSAIVIKSLFIIGLHDTKLPKSQFISVTFGREKRNKQREKRTNIPNQHPHNMRRQILFKATTWWLVLFSLFFFLSFKKEKKRIHITKYLSRIQESLSCLLLQVYNNNKCSSNCCVSYYDIIISK